MNKYYVLLSIAYSSSINYALELPTIPSTNHAITYEFNPGGRFGDQMLTLLKALYSSYTYDIPLLFKSFEYADKLVISQVEKSYHDYKKHFKQVIPITNNSLLEQHHTSATLFVSNLKFKDLIISDFSDFYRYIQTHSSFKQKLTQLIQPIEPLNTFELPTDRITVAVHVRKGGGFDLPLLCERQSNRKYPPYINYLTMRMHYHERFADRQYPTRFPPEHFYINQIKRLSKLLHNKPLWIRLYTDDQNPKAIADRFKKALSNYNVTFSYRATGNTHTSNVLEDFFTMARCDCLIRPASSYSKAAQLLGNHKIIIYLHKAGWRHNILVIHKVGIITNDGTTIKICSMT